MEPAAGDGAFLDRLPEPRVGLDLSPAAGRADIVRADFLAWRPGRAADTTIVIGNPPFGKNASLAIRFLNHASGFADWVAFIVPRTFEKDSTKRKLAPFMTLVHEEALGPDCFVFEGQPYDVPTVFQVWKRTAALRMHEIRDTKHPDFEFVRPTEILRADFAFQRVGARAGLVSVEGLRKSPQSHYFIKVRNTSRDVLSILRGIDWTSVKHRTAGNPSIGKAELIAEYRRAVH